MAGSNSINTSGEKRKVNFHTTMETESDESDDGRPRFLPQNCTADRAGGARFEPPLYAGLVEAMAALLQNPNPLSSSQFR